MMNPICNEYPLFYFMGANYKTSTKPNEMYELFKYASIIPQLQSIGDGMFSTEDCQELDYYLRQYYGRYLVRPEYYSFEEFKRAQFAEVEECTYTIANYFVNTLIVENMNLRIGGKQYMTNYADTIQLQNSLMGYVYCVMYTLMVRPQQLLMQDFITEDSMNEFINRLEPNRSIVLGIITGNTGSQVIIEKKEFPACSDYVASVRSDGSRLDNFKIADAMWVPTETPDPISTMDNMRSAIMNLAHIHKQEWRALFDIANAYYNQISDGDILNNYEMNEQRSGKDSIDDSRDLTDVTTPNLTRENTTKGDRTTTPNTTTESEDVNSRVSNVVSDGFHDQSKIKSKTTNSGETMDEYSSKNTETSTGSETITRTGSSSRELSYGRQVTTKGFRDVNKIREYTKMWETARMEYLLAILHDVVPRLLYVSYEI